MRKNNFALAPIIIALLAALPKATTRAQPSLRIVEQTGEIR